MHLKIESLARLMASLRPQLIYSDFILFISLCKGAETKFYNSERTAFTIQILNPLWGIIEQSITIAVLGSGGIEEG
jgi:hypothetical protein